MEKKGLSINQFFKNKVQLIKSDLWKKIVFVFVILISLNSSDILATTYTFTGSGGWASAANWSPSYPGSTIGAADEVIINGFCNINGGLTITINGTLTNNSPLYLFFGTLNINGIFQNNSTVLHDGGVLNNSGTINVNSNTYEIRSGVINNTGIINTYSTLQIQASGTLNNTGTLNINGNQLANFGTLSGAGNVNLNSGGTLALYAATSIISGGNFNWSGGVLFISPSAQITLTNSLTVPSSSNLIIQGVLSIDSGITLTNNGSIQSYAGGTLTNNGTLTNIGTMSFWDNATLELNTNPAAIIGGTVNFSSSATLAIGSNGVMNLTNALSIPAGVTLEVQGVLNINSGGILTCSGTLTNTGTITLNSGGNLILNNNLASLPGGVFNWNSGSTLTVGSSGEMSITSAFTVPVGTTLRVFGILKFDVGSTLINSGIFDLESAGNLILNTDPVSLLGGNFNWNSGSTLTIGTAGILTLTSSLTVPIGRTLDILGTVNINSGATLTNEGTLTNSGTIELNSGSELHLNAAPSLIPGGTFNMNSGSTLTIGASGILTLSNSFTIPTGTTLQNLGTINIASSGELTDEGTLTNTGILEVSSGGNFVLNTDPVSIPGGTFNLNSGSTFTIGSSGVLTLINLLIVPTGVTLDILGTIIINSGGTLTNEGTLTNTGTLELNSGGELILNTDPATIPGGTFNLNTGSTLTIGSSGILSLNSTLSIPANSTLQILGTLNINTGGELTNSGVLTNSGILNLNSGGNLVLNTNPASIPGGTFNRNIGSTLTVGLSGVLTLTGNFDVPAGTTLDNLGVLNIHTGALLSNFGIFTNSGTLELDSGSDLVLNTDPVSLPGGTFNRNIGSTLTIGSAGVLTLATALTVPTGTILDNLGAIIINSGGSLANEGTLNNAGILDVNSGGDLVLNTSPANLPGGTFNWNNNGMVTIGSSGIMTVATAMIVPDFAILKIYGTLINNSILTVNGTLANSGTLTNYGTLVDNEVVYSFGTGNVFLNLESGSSYIINSTFTQWPGSGTNLTFNWKSGSTVSIGTTGFVEYNDGVDLIIENGTTLTNDGMLETFGAAINNNGTLAGTGTIYSGTITNSGTAVLAPGNSVGTLNFSGDIVLGGSDYFCEIDGAAGTTDLIAGSGNAILTGANLEVSWLNFPTAPGTYVIMTFGSRTGNFNSVSIDPVPGASFTTNYSATEVSISVSGVFPIELIDFKAYQKNETVELVWHTSSEQNNEGFYVERTDEFRDWKILGFVEGSGTTAEEKYYSFLDENPIPGNGYYRLRQEDFDGKYEYSKVISVDFDLERSYFKIFPNPAVHHFTGLYLNVRKEQSGTLDIYDVSGKKVYTQKIQSEGEEKMTVNIDIQNIPTGTYIVNFLSGANSYSEKLIIAP